MRLLFLYYLVSQVAGLGIIARDTPTPPSEINQYLTAHNSIRAQHGASPLVYSQALATKAQQWADNCLFEHSNGTLGKFGENLAVGTGTFTIPQAVKAWTDEVGDYDPRNPQPSHFTQVVWKGTREVGCAFRANCTGIFASEFGQETYYVCEYTPQGNIIGQFDENVQATASSDNGGGSDAKNGSTPNTSQRNSAEGTKDIGTIHQRLILISFICYASITSLFI